jgi:hypothetical protein
MKLFAPAIAQGSRAALVIFRQPFLKPSNKFLDGNHRDLDRLGVAVGEKVVTGANFLIDAESNLRAALQAFTAPEGKSP